jgi:hypothetical protein
MGFHEVLWDSMRFCGIPWSSMRFYDVPVNQSVPTEANRGLTFYTRSLTFRQRLSVSWKDWLPLVKPNRMASQLGEACPDRRLQIEDSLD